jgi:hypothetical protein
MPYRILCKMQGVTSPHYRNFLHGRENFCPTDRPTPSIPASRYLHRRSDCHRVERSSPRVYLPLWFSAFHGAPLLITSTNETEHEQALSYSVLFYLLRCKSACVLFTAP